jgi:hypothetical protein
VKLPSYIKHSQLPALTELKVLDPAGESKTLYVSDGDTTFGRTKVFAVASWCPHTKSFIRAISDAQVKAELAEYDLNFVLESDEWPTVRPQIQAAAKAGELPTGMTVDKAIERMKAKAGNGPLVDPEFLDTLPGSYYFLPKGYALAAGFPSVYSASEKKFDEHAMLWVATKSRRAVELYKQFEKIED